MPFSVKIDKKGQLRKLERAFAHVNERVLPANFTYEFNAQKWNWDGETQRRNGTIVSSPRSISDTHALEESYERRKESVTRYSHEWRQRYALLVALGGVLKNGGVIEGRDWTEEPMAHFRDEFVKAYKSL